MESYDLPQIWDRLINKLGHVISEINMDMYIRQITPVKLENYVIYCTVPSTTLCSAIERNFLATITVVLNEITNNNISVDIKVGKQKKPETEIHGIPRKDKTKETAFKNNVNKKQRFDNFVVGNSNRFAAAAAQTVAKDPGKVYNPLFIYGSSGLGKTHLMHAIGNAVLESDPNVKVKYVTSEAFTNEIIDAIRNQTVKSFQEKYRTVDCLIIDDIQFLEKKERTQEEFFHTFNELREADKQIVISCDRNPQYMDKLEERLRGRFSSGLTVDIKPPDLETRMAIIRKKAETEKVDIPNDVIQTIAASIDSNVRMLEGAFNRLVAYTSLMQKPIDINAVDEILKEFVPVLHHTITIENIVSHICNLYSLEVNDLLGKKRVKHIAVPRQMAMYLCRKLTDKSLTEIGSSFVGRDHATVIHAYEKIDKMRKEDKNFDKLLQQFEEQLRSF